MDAGFAETVRARLLAHLGRPPAAVAVAAPRVERTFVADGVRYERWRLAGPCDDIPAWFLLAENAPRPAPVLLALHPHGRQFELGKSQVAGLVGEASRAYGLAAARAGFGVLAPDFPGFEDRRPPLAARKANYALQGEAYERLLAMHALVEGATLQGRILADLAACIDTLALEPRVDASRLAAFGQSFGGQEVLFGMLFDPRIRAGVCSCGFSLVRLLVERSISHNLALYLPGMLPGLDLDEVVPALAPRPLFVIAGRGDAICPVDGVEAVEVRARAAWAAQGAADRLHFHYFDGGHDLPAGALAAALDWLKQAL
jgi:dienelactone hydrolase